jgi:hypothetical protein
MSVQNDSVYLYRPEPHILLFRRALGTNPQNGRIEPELVEAAKAEFKDQMGLRHNAMKMECSK